MCLRWLQMVDWQTTHLLLHKTDDLQIPYEFQTYSIGTENENTVYVYHVTFMKRRNETK